MSILSHTSKHYIMKKKKTFWGELVRKWKAETPIIWKHIRNGAITLALTIPTAYGVITSSGAHIPPVVDQNIWIVIGLSAIIGGVAGLQEKRKEEGNQ